MLKKVIDKIQQFLVLQKKDPLLLNAYHIPRRGLPYAVSTHFMGEGTEATQWQLFQSLNT